MNANAPVIITICAVVCAAILFVSLCKDALIAWNKRHNVITYSDSLVNEVEFNGGGINADGTPYYSSDDKPTSQGDVPVVLKKGA